MPGAEEGYGAAALVLVVFWVDVEEAGLADAASAWILGDGASVPYVETVAVVGLVEVAVNHVLVVVDGTGSASEVATVEGVLQVADVEDVGGWQTLSGRQWSICITLIELVVEEDVLLPCVVVHDTLVSILDTRVSGARDDVRDVAGLVSDIVDGERVLVVAVANISAVVTSIRPTVDNTLYYN